MNANDLKGLLFELKNIMDDNRKYLIKLDSVVGDGDLGLTMGDGFAAAYDAVAESDETDIGKFFYCAGKAMASAVPSTMGTLMASGWMQSGKAFKGKIDIADGELPDIFASYLAGVMNRGKAKPGDKTFVDGLDPAVTAMKEAVSDGKDKKEVAQAGLAGAEEGFKNTTTMIAVHGRAATRGEESRSLEDPGAAVAVLMMKAYFNWCAD